MANYDRDYGRTVSDGLMASLDWSSKYSEPMTLDCSAAADLYGELSRLRRARAQAIDDCIKVVRDFSSDEDGDGIDTCDAIISRLEALKDTKP